MSAMNASMPQAGRDRFSAMLNLHDSSAQHLLSALSVQQQHSQTGTMQQMSLPQTLPSMMPPMAQQGVLSLPTALSRIAMDDSGLPDCPPSTPSSQMAGMTPIAMQVPGLEGTASQGDGNGNKRWPFWKTVSENEFKEKNARRLLHNRISAKLARERKKSFILTLEAEVTLLQEKKLQLETMVSMLSSENDRLRTEMGTAMLPDMGPQIQLDETPTESESAPEEGSNAMVFDLASPQPPVGQNAAASWQYLQQQQHQQ